MTPIDPVLQYAVTFEKNVHTADHGWSIPGALDANRNIIQGRQKLTFLGEC